MTGLSSVKLAAFELRRFLRGRLPVAALVVLAVIPLLGALYLYAFPYPVQTTPGFFQAIHPLLPMTYVVEALRHTIDGGPAGTVAVGLLALVGYGVGALALTVLVAFRSRRLTPAKLHPELVI